MQSDTPLKSEPIFLWGAVAIGAAIGINRRQAFHLLETGAIPAKKIGGRWVAMRDRLFAAIGADE